MDDVSRTGRLVRDAAGFVLEADDGTRYSLELARVPVDHVEKRVRVTGIMIQAGHLVADGVAPA